MLDPMNTAPDVAVSLLPATLLIGRDAELGAVCDLLSRSDVPLFTFTDRVAAAKRTDQSTGCTAR